MLAGTASAEVDSGVDAYAATMDYRPGRFRDRQEFLRAHDQRWVRELHEVLKDLLDPQRLTLGIGSGEGEHEVLLHEAGYRVIASDVVPGVLDDAARLFPGLETRLLDVFGDDVVECDDVLAGGIDFYFDDAEAADLFAAVRRRLIPGGRFVVVLRYRDNLATTAIDRVGLPALAWAQRRRGAHLERKAHGYRRSVGELRKLAKSGGFSVGRVRHAAFGMELERLVPAPAPVVRLDRRLHVLNSAVVFELLTSPGAPGTAGA